MNQQPGLSTAIAIALAVIITAGGMSLVGSFVLCVGSDGHADLELALGACCIDDDGPGGEPDGSTKLVDSCGGCSDIGLDASSLTKGKQRLEPPHLAAMNEPVQARAFPTSLADSGLPTSSGSPHLEGLATVILLT